MKLTITAIATALFLSLISPKAAVAQSDTLDCSNPQNQALMNRCAYLDFENADDELNAIWPAAKNVNADFSSYLPEHLKQDESALLEAQRAWITFRDAHCTAVALPNQGGTIHPLIYNSCRAAVTRQRTEQLRELVKSGQN